jgi:hypothetical protein
MKNHTYCLDGVELDVAMLEGAEATILIAMLDISLDLDTTGVACGYCGKSKMHCIILIYMLARDSNQRQIEAFTHVAKKALNEIDRMNCCGNN